MRLPTSKVLQERISYLLICRSGVPRTKSAGIMPASATRLRPGDKPRRVIAKVEWHLGELYPRAGFIATSMSRPAEKVVAFYNKRGTREQ
jgi:hypothetical protein